MDTANDIHATVQKLLPWFLNRTLGPDEHAQVELHIRDCLSCRRDLKSLSVVADALATPARDIAASASFAALRARIAQPVAPTNAVGVDGRVVALHRRPVVRLALAASLLLVLLPVGLDRLRDRTEDAPYYTLASPAPAGALPADIKVLFAAGTPAATITQALADVGGTASGGPNSAGAFAVRLEGGSAARQQALVLLRARNDVLLAEPVNPP